MAPLAIVEVLVGEPNETLAARLAEALEATLVTTDSRLARAAGIRATVEVH